MDSSHLCVESLMANEFREEKGKNSPEDEHFIFF
jgi:hypothetical protein